MRVTSSELTSGFLLVSFTAFLFLAPNGTIYAQSASRSFQMGMWVYPQTPIPTSTDADIRTFNEGWDQPPGRSIMLLNWTLPVPASGYDWSRIVAVEVDEPYTPVDGDLDQTCGDVNAANAAIAPIDATLAQRASELKAIAPLTRFWVNFTTTEGSWMAFCAAPQVFNRAYIDVISEDYYYLDFNGLVSPFYTVLTLYPAKPAQQLALIPGTFYRSGNDSPGTQASYLQGYFDYANNMNQTCNLPLGSRGVTGIYDGCPVWIVLGWLSGNFTDKNAHYVGELDPSSAPIAAAWRQELALPVRADLAHQLTPGQILQTLLPLFLDN